MMKRLYWNLGAVACLALLLTGCAKMPFAELKATQTARDEARELAEMYAPEEYDAAIALYDQARLEIEAQAGNSTFTKSYSRAQELLLQAKQGFENALQTAKAKRDALKTEAQEKSEMAATALAEAEEALKGVRRSSRNRSDRERWRQNIEELTYTMEDANDYLGSEYYKEAIGYFETILNECETIKTEIAGG